MSLREFIFKDGNSEILLPITPPEYQVEHGTKIETINIHGIGDINLSGYTTLAIIKISCMFPAKKYPFMNSNSKAEPDYYINFFQRCINQKNLLRFIISGTKINLPIKIENISYGEKDGTNDVYAEITLREFRNEKSRLKSIVTGNSKRPSRPQPPKVIQYRVVLNDNLWMICRRYYGDGSLCYKLAKYNRIKNANLIYVGQIVRIPEVSKL